MNNKGFTLVELLATLVILALVMGIGTYSITTIINNSKEKNYESLISNIKDGAETYYQECKYSKESIINMFGNKQDADNFCDYNLTLGELVKYGYVKGNDTDNNKNFSLSNPKDNKDISGCIVNITFSGGKVIVTAVSKEGSCPTEY